MVVIDILTSADEEIICQYLKKIDNIFPVPMSSRVNIQEHTKKVLQRGVIITAKENGEIVGICLGYANDTVSGRAYLGTLGVSEGYRSLGVGSMLVDAMINYAQAKRMLYLALHAHRDNTRAIKFYQKKGFSLTYDADKPYEESVYLTRRL